MATLLAVSILTSTLSVSALATDTTGSGTKEDPYVTVTETSSTDPETGSTTTLRESENTWTETSENTTSSGVETTTVTTVTDSQGSVLSENGSTQSSETTTTTVSSETDKQVDESKSTSETTSETTTSKETQQGQWSEEQVNDRYLVSTGTTQVTDETSSSEAIYTGINDSVTIDLTPGNTAEVQVSVDPNAVDTTNLPSGLTGGNSLAPAQTTETITREDGTVITKVTTALYGADGVTIVGYQVSIKAETKTETNVGDPIEINWTLQENSESTAPEGYTVGKTQTDVTDDSGNKIGTQTVKTEEIYDADGVTVIGYQITTTTTTSDATQISSTQTDMASMVQEQPVTTFTLPEKPAASTTTDPATGETTTVTV
jgi:hypothetical protein